MDFFGMGMGEILLILVVALIIWGPGRIVEIGRTLGKIVRSLRKASFDLTTQITKELEEEKKDRSSQSSATSGDKPKKASDN
ncbi:twin-arginine translocase TatA/TatE family subunit [Chloroflexota bacterium]